MDQADKKIEFLLSASAGVNWDASIGSDPHSHRQATQNFSILVV